MAALPRWRRGTWIFAAAFAFWAVLLVVWFLVPSTNTGDVEDVLVERILRYVFWAFGFAFTGVAFGMYLSIAPRPEWRATARRRRSGSRERRAKESESVPADETGGDALR
jgi:hypothetical protein